MTQPINSTIHFTAQWTDSNVPLKTTLAQKVSRVALYVLHKLAMGMCLPSPYINKKEDIFNDHSSFKGFFRDEFTPKRIQMKTPDGVILDGTFLQKKGCPENAPCVIFMQPNATHYSQGVFNSVVTEGSIEGKECNYLFFDYRGCGLSEGSAVQAKDLVLDGETIYQFAKDHLKVPPSEIHMMGYSFGGGVSAQVKALHPECTGNYVNDRSFSCITDAAREILGGGIMGKIAKVLMRILGFSALNSAKALDKIQSRTLIMHHPQDQMIKPAAQLRTDNPAEHIKMLDLSSTTRYGNFHCMPLERLQLADGRYALDNVTDHLIGHLPSPANQWDIKVDKINTLNELSQKYYFRSLSYILDSNKSIYDENRIADIRHQFSLPEDQGGISKEAKFLAFKDYIHRPKGLYTRADMEAGCL